MSISRNTQMIGETEDQQKFRFQVELEFVQCLANPNYLNYLAQRGTFKEQTFINYLKYLLYWKEPEYAKYLKFVDSGLYLAQRGTFKEQTFINYLKYLLYWKEPEYAKYLKYPQCLHMLELLQFEHFRVELMNTHCAKFIDDQQLLHWQHYQRSRMRLIQEQTDRATTQQTQPQVPSSAVQK